MIALPNASRVVRLSLRARLAAQSVLDDEHAAAFLGRTIKPTVAPYVDLIADSFTRTECDWWRTVPRWEVLIPKPWHQVVARPEKAKPVLVHKGEMPIEAKHPDVVRVMWEDIGRFNPSGRDFRGLNEEWNTGQGRTQCAFEASVLMNSGSQRRR